MRCLVIGSVVLALSLGPVAAVATEEDPSAAGAFSPTGSLSATRAWHSAVPLPDGRVLIVGGEGIDPVLDDHGKSVLDDHGEPLASYLIHHTAEIWDPAAGSFGSAGLDVFGGGWDPAMLLPDGRVLVINSFLVNRPVSVEIWDPDTGSLSPAGALEGVTLGGTRTVLPDGRVLFVGGGIGEDAPVATAQIWDPVTGAVSPTGPPPRPRVGHTATLLPDGRVLVVGGWPLLRALPADAEVWDPDSGTFSPAGSLPDEFRAAHTATLLPDGRVLIVAGTGGGGQPLATAFVWDPMTASFRPAGSLAQARGGLDATHTATLLSDGRVLIVGGSGTGIGGSLASAELWDPVMASFGPAGSLAQARRDHTATLLPDGRVLIVGGRGVEEEAYASAETWEPADA